MRIAGEERCICDFGMYFKSSLVVWLLQLAAMRYKCDI